MTYKDFSGEEGTRTYVKYFLLLLFNLKSPVFNYFYIIKYYNTFYLIISLQSPDSFN